MLVISEAVTEENVCLELVGGINAVLVHYGVLLLYFSFQILT